MPHIIIKALPGRSDEKKKLLTEKITEAFISVFEVSESSISVDIQEISKEDWMENVYNIDILPKKNLLQKKPGYESL